jgi:hypothetical protein
MEDHGSSSSSGDTDTYLKDRRTRLHRNRVVGFSLCILIWVLSVVPLARESMNGREDAGSIAVYLAVAAISLGVAAVIRGLYVLIRKRRYWSPWLFLIASVLAIAGWVVQSAGEKEIPIAGTPAPDSRGEPRLGGAQRI